MTHVMKTNRAILIPVMLAVCSCSPVCKAGAQPEANSSSTKVHNNTGVASLVEGLVCADLIKTHKGGDERDSFGLYSLNVTQDTNIIASSLPKTKIRVEFGT